MEWLRSMVYGAQVISTEPSEPPCDSLVHQPPAHVLTFDGGGMRGLYSLKVAQAIEDRLTGNLLEYVDMLAGSSTGSILAFGLASGKSLKDLENIYKSHGADIFSHSWWWAITDMDGVLGPKYDATSIESLLKQSFSDHPLSSINRTWTQAYSIDITTQKAKVFDTLKAREVPDEDIPIWQAIRASTAAPTYFSAADLKGDALCDGGLNLNNPSVSAVIGIVERYGLDSLASTRLISIGTGDFPTGISYDKARNMGEIGWAVPISDMIIKSSTHIYDQWSATLLKDKYIRVNGQLTQDLPLDGYSPSNLQSIETAALTYINANPETIDKAAKLLQN